MSVRVPSLTLGICVATMRAPTSAIPSLPGDVPLLTANAVSEVPILVHVQYNTVDVNLGVVGSYQKLYTQSTEDVLVFIHDDVIMRERGWDARVLQEFEDPKVGVVGFGGALQHGADEIYRVPYRLQQLARFRYLSNVDDAEVHGTRFSAACDVAVLDGFALVIRRSLLDQCNGWPVDRYPPHHNYDYWLCCMAHRLGFRVRCVGVRCHHRGGGTAVGAEYHKWCETTRWGSDAVMHAEGHRLVYEEFRDVLPWRCM